uniref:Phosphagen kinase N-terminal domain-containing protein n=1 Tax=Magallana gigas TaxID=29159 RepID=A0A8W8JKH7_MAGGI
MSDLASLWKRLRENASKSLLKKHLTPDRYEKLKNRKTKLGGTLADCIRSGTARAEISTPDARDGIRTIVGKSKQRREQVFAEETLNAGKIQVT